MSRPLSLWDEDDIWKYIIENKVEISPIYGLEINDLFDNGYRLRGYRRSGCSVCMFGLSLEDEISRRTYGKIRNRFELLFDTKKSVYEMYMHEKKYNFWKPLTDMGIHLNVNDKKYEKKYKIRLKALKRWYFYAKNNVNKILDELEERYSKSSKNNKKNNLFTKADRNYILKTYSKKDIYGKI